MNHRAGHVEFPLDCSAKPSQEEWISNVLHMMALAGGNQHTGTHHVTRFCQEISLGRSGKWGSRDVILLAHSKQQNKRFPLPAEIFLFQPARL